MTLLFLENIIAASFIRALCWTLIHSLWIGAIAALMGASVLLVKRLTAATRYNLLTAILGLFVIATSLVFYQQLNGSNYQPAGLEPGNSISSTLMPDQSGNSILQMVETWCNANAPWIVAIWFIIFCVHCMSTIKSVYALNRIRTKGIHEVTPQWKKVVNDLRITMGIRSPVVIKASELVQQPVVIGFLRPLILVPIGLLMNLPADEAEAILLHELAHIKRRDYFVNLLQSFVESAFFFNPGVWWLSQRIRDEREHCCDDAAVSVTGDKTGFVRALVSFNELYVHKYAMGFAGRRHGLLERARRIVHAEQFTFSGLERLSFIMFFITGIVILSFTLPANINTEKAVALQHITFIKKPDTRHSRQAIKPLKAQQKRSIKPATVAKPPVLADSIPKGASKEFIDGYKAALNYRKGIFSAEEKKRIEEEIRRKRGIDEQVQKQQ